MKPHVPEPPLKQNLKLKEKSEVITSITHASQRSHKTQRIPIISSLNITYFKTRPCEKTDPHLYAHCPYFHTEKDKKRYGNFYSEQMCPYILKEQVCPNGENCQYSHTRIEKIYHLNTYKKTFCEHFQDPTNKCENGFYCPYAHNQQEIKTELLHNYEFDEDFYLFFYKTAYCPFTLIEHDKNRCVYAHDEIDYRRSPLNYGYAPLNCYDYHESQQVCEKGHGCDMGHNWYEISYHPHFYRTRLCEQPYCQSPSCPYFHTFEQKREIQEELLTGIFHYVPRNRITKNIFKFCNQEEHYVPRPPYQSPKSKSTLSLKKAPETKNGYVCKTEIANYKKEQEEIKKNQKQSTTRYLIDQQEVESDVQDLSDYE